MAELWLECLRQMRISMYSITREERPWPLVYAAKHALYNTEISNLVIGVADTSISSV